MEQSEREKAEFLKLCGERDRKKLLGEVEITGGDVDRLSGIMDVLGMYAYETDFILEHIGAVQMKEWESESAETGLWRTGEELREQLEGWLREFCGCGMDELDTYLDTIMEEVRLR